MARNEHRQSEHAKHLRSIIHIQECFVALETGFLRHNGQRPDLAGPQPDDAEQETHPGLSDLAVCPP